MRARAKFWQPAVRFDQVIAVTFRMRRSESNPLNPFNLMNRLEQLHKWRMPLFDSDLTLAITRHDLPQQRDLFYAARCQISTFLHDIRNRPAPFLSARVGNNAKCAVLVAPLHDAYKRAE